MPSPFGLPLPLPPFAIPGTPENQAHTRSVLKLLEMLRGTLTPERQAECDEERDEAIKKCREMIARGGPRGLTGGYTDPEDCARGLISEECGGNPVDRDPQPKKPKRR